ncbi:MAG: DUF3800 domain-containing protein [Chloroflexi bacterium]|nr:DUF3800 domain-containing protein [Chloroflexota bacterium]
MTQYHFLDESGDPGLEGQVGSSSFFVLAMVQFPQRVALSEFTAVRQKFHLPEDFEFKFYRAKPRQKIAIFEAVQETLFRVRAVAIDKSRLAGPLLRMNGQELTIEFIAGLVMRASELDVAGDVLVVDGATRAFLQALRIRLSRESRRLGRVRPFETIVSGKSHRHDELQLADMIAGATREYVIGEEPFYYRMFADKVADLWEAPGSRQ